MFNEIYLNNSVNFITNFVLSQTNAIFPDGNSFLNLRHSIEVTISDQIGFDKIKIWSKNPILDVMNSIQYPIFLYKLSRILFQEGDITGATKIFYLNKVLHSIDLFYEIDLKKDFLLSHSVGSVFCKATYGNYSVFYHGILVGTNNSDRPKFNDGIVMFPGSKIIGGCNIGENVVISASTMIINKDIPDNTCVFPTKGQKLIFKDLNEYYVDRYFIRDNK